MCYLGRYNTQYNSTVEPSFLFRDWRLGSYVITRCDLRLEGRVQTADGAISYTRVRKVLVKCDVSRNFNSLKLGHCRNYLRGKKIWILCSMESAITGLKKISGKRAVAFSLSGSVLKGVPNVLRELCGSECTIQCSAVTSRKLTMHSWPPI